MASMVHNGVFYGIPLFITSLIFACSSTYETIINETNAGGGDMGNKLVASGMAQMVRTTAQGSVAGLAPTGVQIPTGLQVSPLDPGNYTIEFTVLPPADGLGFAAYAIVNWKTAGHQLTRKVSVFSGAVLSGVCDSVDIFIVDVSQIGVAGFPVTPQAYQVGISLSRGARAANMQPATLMTQLSALPIIPNSDSNFTIPSDAGVISALVTAARQSNNSGIGSGGVIIPTDVFARQYSQGSIVLNTWYPIAQSPGWVPIAGNAVSVDVRNEGTNNALINVIWGIEG